MRISLGLRAMKGSIRRGVSLSLALIAVVALILGFLMPVFGAEDSGTRIKNLKVSVWPEYDEPRVLVMYQGEFADKASFPKSVKFRLPAGAEVGQVCALTEKQEHLCQLYETTKGEDFIEITYTLPIPTFFVEYYYNPIPGETARDIAFTYANVYPADKMDVEVQQPLRSSDFNMTPNALTVGTDNQGFKYHQLSFDNVKAEQKVDLKIAYNKQDKNSSVPKAKQGGGVSGSPTDTNIYLLVGAAAALAVVVYVGLTRRSRRLALQPARGQSRPAPNAGPARYTNTAARPSAPRANPSARGQQPRPQGGRFCAGCGAPLAPDDRFCPSCGKKSKGKP